MDQNRFAELERIIRADYGNINGIVVWQNGSSLYKKYFGYGANDAFHVFSVTKSVLSILIGIAIDLGLINGVEQRISEFFPDFAKGAGEGAGGAIASVNALEEVTIENLLTMMAAYKFDVEPYAEFFASESWVQAALESLAGASAKFRYTPIVGPDILSGILQRATGMQVLEFAQEYLFAPLGIDVPHSVELRDEKEHMAFMEAGSTSGWVADPQGVNAAAWGLSLLPVDMAKIGQLYLNGGLWDGERIISAEWVKESTRAHSRWEELGLDYGYLWWVLGDGCYAALGDGGNAIYINEGKQLVVSIASSFMQNARDRIELIRGWIEPVLAG